MVWCRQAVSVRSEGVNKNGSGSWRVALTKSATQNWKQTPIILAVMALSVLVWISLQANELGLGWVCGGETVSVPRGMNHASIGKAGLKRSAMIVSLPKEGDVYWDRWHTAKEALPDIIRQAAAGKPGPDRIVYVKAAFDVSHQEIVELLKLVRGAGMNRVGLVVHQQSVPSDRAGHIDWFEVRLEPEANPGTDISGVYPNPGSLVAAIGPGGKLTLNATDMGRIEDPSLLASGLTEILAERAREGIAERTVAVRAADKIEYGEVARLVDCLSGAGADPIVMQLSGNPQTKRKRRLDSR